MSDIQDYVYVVMGYCLGGQEAKPLKAFISGKDAEAFIRSRASTGDHAAYNTIKCALDSAGDDMAPSQTSTGDDHG